MTEPAKRGSAETKLLHDTKSKLLESIVAPGRDTRGDVTMGATVSESKIVKCVRKLRNDQPVCRELGGKEQSFHLRNVDAGQQGRGRSREEDKERFVRTPLTWGLRGALLVVPQALETRTPGLQGTMLNLRSV